MHNNYYFLRQLSTKLERTLAGYSVVSCFSQNRDELVVELNNKEQSFFIKAHLLPAFSCLSFPGQFARAKKNSVDLFDDLVLREFIGVRQFENERSFALNFKGELSLIFKLHGNRSNILLTREDSVIKVFKNQFSDDLTLTPMSLDKQIDWSESTFLRHQDELHKIYYTLGKPVWEYLALLGFENATVEKRWEIFNYTLTQLEKPEYFIQELAKPRLVLLPLPSTKRLPPDPIEALNEFFYQYTSKVALGAEKQTLTKALLQKIQACESYIEKNTKKLQEIEYDSHFKLWADLLMANMHSIQKGADKANLMDFEQRPVTIKLKPELSVQKNAENYYRKSKNQEIEINKLKTSIDQKQTELSVLAQQLATVEAATTVKDLKKIHPQSAPPTKSSREASIPFHTFEFQGFQIWVGKSATSNDELTQKFTHKDDLWLHAKDVAGSHVVVKHQSGRPFPRPVIERAAELAAYNSKRKNETLCPVMFTPKKFVRKRKGDPPGTVVVDREEVIMVTPKL